MRLAHCGDLHIKKRDQHNTLDAQVRNLLFIGRDAASEGAEVIVCGGDVFDAKSEPEERQAAIEVFASWASEMPVVIARGNHDVPQDLLFLSKLRTRFAIHVYEHAELLDLGSVAVAVLPWIRKAHLVAAMPAASAGDINEVAGKAMQGILTGFRTTFAGMSKPRVLLGHVELGGARMDSGQPVVGRPDVNLHEADLLDVGADVVCLSHIHMHQVLGDGRIVYAGSPRQMNFGEGGAKGYCIIDVEHGKAPVIMHRKAPYREMHTVEGAWDETIGQFVTSEDDGPGELWSGPKAGDAVRLVYVVNEDMRRAAAEWADKLRDQWVEKGVIVKLDPRIITSHRVRSDEIKEARTTADRLNAYWAARGAPPARAAAITDKLTTLEGAL